MSALADEVLTHYAGHRFVRTAVVDSHHGVARYGWDLTGADSASHEMPASTGHSVTGWLARSTR